MGPLLRGIRELETATGDSLIYELGEGGTPSRLASRDDAVEDAVVTTGWLPLLSNGIGGRHVSVTGHIIPSNYGAGGVEAFEILVRTPASESYVSAGPRIVGRVGQALEAYWGRGSSSDLAAAVFEQTEKAGRKSRPPFDLPVISPQANLGDPACPNALGWVNYWSRRTVELLRVRKGDSRLVVFEDAENLLNGAMVVVVTKEFLEVANLEHLARLKRAYDRFPEIGARDRLAAADT
jgi:hypothetical protein